MAHIHNPNWEPGTFFHLHPEDPKEEYENFKFGMWIFLATEVLLFGGIFACYFIFKWRHPEVFGPGSSQLSPTWGGVNTIVLLASSFTMALAVDAAQRSQQKKLKLNLFFTLIGASIFLIVKYLEWGAKYAHGWFPVKNELWDSIFSLSMNVQHLHMSEYTGLDIFFSLYFMATGLHLLHVLVGMFFIGLLLVRSFDGRYHEENFGGVEVGGLYWHIVDIIWIFLFPLLYLI